MDADWWRMKAQRADIEDFQGEKLTLSKKIDCANLVHLPHHGNSGAGALLLAERNGANRIIMLGFDCGHASDGKTHWHGDHPAGIGNARSAPKWPAQFAQVAGWLAGIEVINASRSTRLKQWPLQTLEEALNG